MPNQTNLILQPHTKQPLGDMLQTLLAQHDYHRFQAAVAFAKKSGVQHIEATLQTFAQRNGQIRLVVGVDHQGTSYQGLQRLLEAVGETGEVWIQHNEDAFVTFHPKIYLFEGEVDTVLIIGSGNLTQGGLYTNDEAMIMLNLSSSDPILSEIRRMFDTWCDETSDRSQVPMKLGDEIFMVNMMTWPDRHDFRLRSEFLRSAGNIGDILQLERVTGENYTYMVTIISQQSTNYQQFLELCPNQPRNSQKRWGVIHSAVFVPLPNLLIFRFCLS